MRLTSNFSCIIGALTNVCRVPANLKQQGGASGANLIFKIFILSADKLVSKPTSHSVEQSDVIDVDLLDDKDGGKENDKIDGEFNGHRAPSPNKPNWTRVF